MKRLLIRSLLAALLALAATAAEKPNILFVMLDDMGYGDPGCFNPDSKIPTPNIDRLAGEGMRFTDAHTAGGTCIPSRFGFLTGCYPIKERGSDRVLKQGRVTIPSLLRQQGYSTAMVGKWHNGFWNWDINKQPVPEKLEGGPHGCGFDYWFGIPHSLDMQPYLYIETDHALAKPTEKVADSDSIDQGWTRIQGAFWRGGGIAPGFRHDQVLGKFTEKSINFLKGHANSQDKRPFFLYIAMAGPHTPWLPSREFSGKSGAGIYGDFLMEIDDCLGRIFRTLENTGAAENTMICLASDNGPVWYSQDVEKFGHDSVGPLRGMKGDVFEGGHRVPFIAKWPGKIQPGTTCREVICLTDMMATYATVTGTELPQGAGLDSVDLLPLMKGGKDPVRRATLHKGKMRGLRMGNYKYMEKAGSGGFTRVETRKDDPPQLYNLENDLAETRNLYHSMPEKVAEMKAELERIGK